MPRTTKRDKLLQLMKEDPKHLSERTVNEEIGFGLFTDVELTIGEYICQYRGELLSCVKADDRKHYGYLFYFTHNGETLCVDAFNKSKSGIARYANDDWIRPNARVVKEIVDTKPYLFLKCIRNIKPGLEIRYDYHDSSAPWRIKFRKENTCKSTAHEDFDEVTQEAPDDSSSSSNCEPSPTKDLNHSKNIADPVVDFDELTPSEEAQDDSSASSNYEDSNHSKNMADPVAASKASETPVLPGTKAETRGINGGLYGAKPIPQTESYGDLSNNAASGLPGKQLNHLLLAKDEDASLVNSAPITTTTGTSAVFGTTSIGDGTMFGNLAISSAGTTTPGGILFGEPPFTNSTASTTPYVSSYGKSPATGDTLVSSTCLFGKPVTTSDTIQNGQITTNTVSSATNITSTTSNNSVFEQTMTASTHGSIFAALSTSNISNGLFGQQISTVASTASTDSMSTIQSAIASTTNSGSIFGQLAVASSSSCGIFTTSAMSTVTGRLFGQPSVSTTTSDVIESASITSEGMFGLPSTTFGSGFIGQPASQPSNTTEISDLDLTDLGGSLDLSSDHEKFSDMDSDDADSNMSDVVSYVCHLPALNPVSSEDNTGISSISKGNVPSRSKPKRRCSTNQLDENAMQKRSKLPEEQCNMDDSFKEMPSTSDVETQVSVMTVSKNKVGRDYSKRHFCYFCGKGQIKISRHIVQQHSDIKEIAILPSVSSGDKKRKSILNKYRNLGNFVQNVKILSERKGNLIVGRRPNDKKLYSPDQYLPCQFCFVFYLAKELWRHTKNCTFISKPLEYKDISQEKRAAKECTSAARMLIQGATGKGAVGFEIDNEQFVSQVIEAMHVDNVSMTVKSDQLLVLFGQSQFNKLGTLKACHVREKLRIMGRLKLILRKNSGRQSALIEEFIHPNHFDTCVEGVKDLSGVTQGLSLSGTKTFSKPSLAIKAGHLLKKLAELKKGQAIRKTDITSKEAATEFIELYNSEWSTKISSIAQQNLKEVRFNKETILPLTADLQKLTTYLEKEMKMMTKTIQLGTPSMDMWRKLAEITLTRLIMFNKRRAEEPAQILLEKFLQRPKDRNVNEELLNSLQPMEKSLMKTMDIVEVLGKKNRKVPILMTETMLASVNALVTTRGKVGIHEVNPFIFAVGENGHLRGCATVKRTVVNCPEKIEYPELITSTKLRKYMATVSQVFKLSNSQLEELARHMGHELAVHRQYYRLQEDVVELAKVSKLLLTVEKGKAHRFKGMSLDDIQLDDLDELTSSEEAPDDSSAGLNCEPSPTDDSNHSNKMADPVADFDEVTQEAPDDSSSSSNCEPSPTEDLNHSKNMADPVAGLSRRLNKQEKTFEYDEQSSEDEYVPKADDESSDVSDDDVSISKKKSLKKSRKRTLWNKHEKEALENMILPMIRKTGKPPQKKDVLLAITRSGETLKSRDWKSIKFQSWGMLQQERRKKNQMVDQLLKKKK